MFQDSFAQGKKKCPICNKMVSKLSRHVMIHSGMKPYACHLCNFRSNQSSNLSLHVQRKHTSGSGKKQCPICNKMVSLLDKHIMTHSGEKPYTCNFCDYRTTQSSNLNFHVRQKHTHGGESRETVCLPFVRLPGKPIVKLELSCSKKTYY